MSHLKGEQNAAVYIAEEWDMVNLTSTKILFLREKP